MPNHGCQNMLFWLQAGTEQEAFTPLGEEKKQNKNLLQQPRGLQRQGAEASVARPVACEGDSMAVPLLVRVAGVMGPGVVGNPEVGQGGGAGPARAGGQGHGQRVA